MFKIEEIRKVSLVAVLSILCIVFVFSGCDSTNSRVTEALEKMEAAESMIMVGSMEADMEANGEKVEMKAEYEFTIEDEDKFAMAMNIEADSIEMTVEAYLLGDEMYMYMYMPPYLDMYMDASSLIGEMKEGMQIDLTTFDFDVESTEIEANETTIELEGQDIEVLKVQVLINEDQISDIVQDLFAQQNFASDSLSGQALSETADIYESIVVESAEYTLYIDNNNNVKRYSVDAVFTMEILGQTIGYDAVMNYDIIQTGDDIKVEVPEIPDDIMSFEELLKASS